MAKNLRRQEQTTARIAVARAPGRQPLRSEDDPIDLAPAVGCSYMTSLYGRPFPVQFRSQGAIDAWTQALGNTELWRSWQDPGTMCWDIRQEVSRQLKRMYPTFLVSMGRAEQMAATRRLLEIDIGTNLKYHLHKGTVIEATPTLETLLTNSDVDLSLPMSIVAPPYRAQYLRFGEVAMRYLKVPDSPAPDHVFDGVFCFFTQAAPHSAIEGARWTLELVFIIKQQDCCHGHVILIGDTDRGSTTVGEWLAKVLDGGAEYSADTHQRSMHAAISYVVRVFLYMTLKQARVMEHPEYDAALHRAAGLGDRKRAKLLQRSASLYNSILVGPEFSPSSAATGGAATGVASHWRRGHFRMQPCGVGNQQRKLIFVAPILIHADQLKGEVPAPKSYRAVSSNRFNR